MENKDTLYDITAELQTLLDGGFTADFVDEDGLIDEAGIEARIDELQLSFDEKVDGIASYIKSQRKLAEDIREEAKALIERAKAKEARIDRLQEYTLNCMRLVGKTRFESARNVVTLRKSMTVQVDETIIPKEYLRETVKVEPDKKAIKEALKDGKEIVGAFLVEKENVQIK